MTWRTTTDPGHFLAVAGPWLAADAVAHAPLLTEADHWRRTTTPLPGALAGWSVAGGGVGAAFVHLPGHPPLCSRLAPASVPGLLARLGGEEALGVDGRDVEAVLAGWGERGVDGRAVARLPVLRLRARVARPRPPGAPRVAVEADRERLHDWFAQFRRRHPEDPSDREYVVDEPLAAGAIVLWEVDGVPVAMASRTPVVAGVTRLGLAFQPSPGHELADAAFAAACDRASADAQHVVALSGSAESTARLTAHGFEVAAERVLLAR